MSSFSFKYWNISPKVLSETVVGILMPMIKNHNDSLGRNNQHLFIFSQIRKQNGIYRGVCLGFGRDTVKIVKYFIVSSREKAKTLLKDTKPLVVSQ